MSRGPGVTQMRILEVLATYDRLRGTLDRTSPLRERALAT